MNEIVELIVPHDELEGIDGERVFAIVVPALPPRGVAVALAWCAATRGMRSTRPHYPQGPSGPSGAVWGITVQTTQLDRELNTIPYLIRLFKCTTTGEIEPSREKLFLKRRSGNLHILT